MAKTDSNRFHSDAGKYAAYLETPEGRLRLDLAFANLQEFLGPAKHSLRTLDLGCGTGATGVRLARLGFQVTLMDSSPAMLDLARQAAQESAVADKITLKLGDAAQSADLFATGLFDVILCHNLLEYVDDSQAVLCGSARLMRDSSAILSVVVRNQAGELLKSAIQTGDLDAAENNLSAEWTTESLYGGKVRLFTLEKMRAMLKAASFEIIAERGVRIFTDYLPLHVSRTEQYQRILDLERKLGRRTEFVGAARYVHYLARRSNLVTEHGT